MYFDQEGKCGVSVCGSEATVIDHCHRTGRVRGLLCVTCNVQLSWIENTAWLESATTYLEQYK
jgi:hypothetical protein